MNIYNTSTDVVYVVIDLFTHTLYFSHVYSHSITIMKHIDLNIVPSLLSIAYVGDIIIEWTVSSLDYRYL